MKKHIIQPKLPPETPVKLETSMSILVGRAVLHNIAINNNDIIEEMDDNMDEPDAGASHNAGGTNENTSVRSALLLTHFNGEY